MSACHVPADTGAVRAVIASVDCNTRDFAHQGYVALTGGEAFQSGLTLVLTIYVALVGYRLLFASDGARLTDAPRMALKIGAVLALVTSWNLFETLAFDLVSKAPAEIAQVISPGQKDPVGRLQVAYDQLAQDASAFDAQGRQASQSAAEQTAPTVTPAMTPPKLDGAKAEAAQRDQAAARALTAAAGAVLTVDTGSVAVAMVALGVLGAIGPLFIVLLLFDQTRGFFEGWVRAIVAAGLASMSAWTLILLMGTVLEPWLVALAQQRELSALEPEPAMTAAAIVFAFTAAQLAMVAGSAVIAFGFRMISPLRFWPQAQAQAQAQGRSVETTTTGVIALAPRASLLADQLRRFDGVIEGRTREAAAASMRLIQPGLAWEPGFAVATDYRRAGPSRDHLGRRSPRR